MHETPQVGEDTSQIRANGNVVRFVAKYQHLKFALLRLFRVSNRHSGLILATDLSHVATWRLIDILCVKIFQGVVQPTINVKF